LPAPLRLKKRRFIDLAWRKDGRPALAVLAGRVARASIKVLWRFDDERGIGMADGTGELDLAPDLYSRAFGFQQVTGHRTHLLHSFGSGNGGTLPERR
jgi:hypothetical protein